MAQNTRPVSSLSSHLVSGRWGICIPFLHTINYPFVVVVVLQSKIVYFYYLQMAVELWHQGCSWCLLHRHIFILIKCFCMCTVYYLDKRSCRPHLFSNNGNIPHRIKLGLWIEEKIVVCLQLKSFQVNLLPCKEKLKETADSLGKWCFLRQKMAFCHILQKFHPQSSIEICDLFWNPAAGECLSPVFIVSDGGSFCEQWERILLQRLRSYSCPKPQGVDCLFVASVV